MPGHMPYGRISIQVNQLSSNSQQVTVDTFMSKQIHLYRALAALYRLRPQTPRDNLPNGRISADNVDRPLMDRHTAKVKVKVKEGVGTLQHRDSNFVCLVAASVLVIILASAAPPARPEPGAQMPVNVQCSTLMRTHLLSIKSQWLNRAMAITPPVRRRGGGAITRKLEGITKWPDGQTGRQREWLSGRCLREWLGAAEMQKFRSSRNEQWDQKWKWKWRK
ncbi:hypothetical protein C8R44DRAFT_748424 [Mycena epipterygia]|nr:hypothetical protein C8R44DRAFT_748424 [Mycena epipterygia]